MILQKFGLDKSTTSHAAIGLNNGPKGFFSFFLIILKTNTFTKKILNFKFYINILSTKYVIQFLFNSLFHMEKQI